MKSDDCIKSVDGQLMVIAAHRYCLGRRSYIVGTAIDWLTLWWKSFERNTKRVILRDTIQSIQDDLAGADIDKKGWLDFSKKHFYDLCSEDQDWVRTSVRIDQPFPLRNEL